MRTERSRRRRSRWAVACWACPILVTVLGTGEHGDLSRLARKPLGRTRAQLLFRWAWFAALSAEAGQELRARGVPPGRVLALPNGVDLDVHRPATAEERRRLRKRLGLPPDRFVASFVGRLHPVKDVDTLLAAAARVPELTLVVVGDGPERRRLEAKAHELGIESRVIFRGLSSDVADVLRASDAFLLSSHGEGMSNALLEAMACGLPCLASRSVGGAQELLGTGRGLLLADGDVSAWAMAIQRLLDEPALRSRDRHGGRGLRRARALARRGRRPARAAPTPPLPAWVAPGVSQTGAPPIVLYVVSRFPAVTETFVVNEWLALSERFRMQLVSLRRTREAPVHSETRRVMPRVRFLSEPRAGTITAHLRLARPAPARLSLGARRRAARSLCGCRARRAPRSSWCSCSPRCWRAARPATASTTSTRISQAIRLPRPGSCIGSPASPSASPPTQTTSSSLLLLLERKAADARFVIAISEYNRRVLHERCPGPTRVEVVHCGVDLERFDADAPRRPRSRSRGVRGQPVGRRRAMRT